MIKLTLISTLFLFSCFSPTKQEQDFNHAKMILIDSFPVRNGMAYIYQTCNQNNFEKKDTFYLRNL